MESFQITTNVKKTDTCDDYISDGNITDGSEISISDESYNGDEEDHTDVLNFISNAFLEVAHTTAIAYREFNLVFKNPNAILTEEEVDSFDILNNVPILNDPIYFIPFVSFLKMNEPSLTGVVLQTNLEGGGSLII
jgi:hypothetical protein